MRIIALTDSVAPWHSFWIRFGQYLDELPWQSQVTESCDDIDKLEEGDILFFYRYQNDWNDRLEMKLKELKKRKIKIITDIDDCVWQAPLGWNYKRKKMFTRAVRYADLITCSTRNLEILINQMFRGQKILIIPNATPIILKRRNRQSQNDEIIKLCWSGCPWTRPDDLKIIRPMVKWLKEENIQVKWKHIGHAEGRLTFAQVVGLDNEEVEKVSVRGYAEYLREIEGDIGLAPVKEMCFNTYKSEIKLLEYSGCGMTWIASSSPAYQDLSKRWGLTDNLCTKEEDWIQYEATNEDRSKK